MEPDPFTDTASIKVKVVGGVPRFGIRRSELPEVRYDDLPKLVEYVRNELKGEVTVWELQRYFKGDRCLARDALSDLDLQKLVDVVGYDDPCREKVFPDSPGHVYPLYRLTEFGRTVDPASLKASHFRDVDLSSTLELERLQPKFPHYSPD